MVPELTEGVWLGPAGVAVSAEAPILVSAAGWFGSQVSITEPDWLRRSCSLPPTCKWKLMDLSVAVLQAWSCTGGGAFTEAVPPPWARLLMLSAHRSAAVTAPPDGIWELLVPSGRLRSGSSAAAAARRRTEVGRSSGGFLFMPLEAKLNDEATPPEGRLLLQTERLLLVARQPSPGNAAAV